MKIEFICPVCTDGKKQTVEIEEMTFIEGDGHCEPPSVEGSNFECKFCGKTYGIIDSWVNQ